MVKTYLRYCFSDDLGVVNSPECNIVFDNSGSHIFTGTNEFVRHWNPRTGEVVSKLALDETTSSSSGYVTVIATHPLSSNIIASGYSDGSIRLWDLSTKTVIVTFHGHQSGISVLQFSLDGHLLVSGGWDTDIVVWDIVGQAGLYRLRGHKNRITALRFLYSQNSKDHSVSEPLNVENGEIKKKRRRNTITEIGDHIIDQSFCSFVEMSRTPDILISGSKDGTVKFWDLSTQWCMETLFDSSGEVWSLAVNPTETRLIIGSSDHQLKIYSINNKRLDPYNKTPNTVNNTVPIAEYLGSISRPNGRNRISDVLYAVDSGSMVSDFNLLTNDTTHQLSSFSLANQSAEKSLTSQGTLLTGSTTHIASLNIRQMVLVVSPGTKSVEIYREFTPSEQLIKYKKRKRRAAEKLKKKKNRMEEIQKFCEQLDNQIGERKRTPIGTTYDAEREVALAKLEVLTVEMQELKEESESQEPAIIDQFHYIHTFHLNKKPTAVSFNQLTWSLVFGFNDQSFEVFHLPLDQLLLMKGPSNKTTLLSTIQEKGNDELEKSFVLPSLYTISSLGHSGYPRDVCVSHDDSLIASFAEKTVYIWNSDSLKLILHMDLLEQLLCGFFVAGNSHVVIGTTKGTIILLDITSCCVTDKLLDHHTGPIIALAEHPNRTGFVTISKDKTLKSFQFFILQSKTTDNTKLETIHCKETHSLQLMDEPLAVTFSPNSNYIAVSLLDFTIQIFYSDTKKLFLTLYGHKLPCNSIDISCDSTMLVTGSKDKTIKVWDLDHGNILKSWHAHDDDVTKVIFLKNTHYVVSTGKDSLIKLWDVDRRDLICQLSGHMKGITCLTTTRLDADRIITGSLDGSLRFWKRTDKQLFVDDEKERIFEEKFNREAARSDILVGGGSGAQEVVLTRATRKTVESTKSTEELMEAIELAYSSWKEIENYREALTTWSLQQTINEQNKLTTHLQGNKVSSLSLLIGATKPEPPTPQIKLFGASPHHYLFDILTRLPTALQHEVVVGLPFSFAEKLLLFVGDVLENIKLSGHNQHLLGLYPLDAITRISLLTVHIHMRQFIAFPSHRDCLLKLQQNLRPILLKEKETIEFNSVALQYLKKKVDDNKYSLSI